MKSVMVEIRKKKNHARICHAKFLSRIGLKIRTLDRLFSYENEERNGTIYRSELEIPTLDRLIL